MKNLRYIKDLILKNRFRYLGGILCLLAVDVLQLILPGLLGTLTDRLNAGSLSPRDILTYSLSVLAIAAGIASFRFLWRYLILGVSKRIETDLRERFHLHLQKLGAVWYSTHKTGDLMAHATNDIGNITTAAGMGVIISVDSLLIPVVALTMMIASGGLKLTAASFAPLILLLAFAGVFMKQMQSRITKMQESFSDMTETARENFSGIRAIKAFVQEAREIARFEAANGHNRRMNLRFVRLMSMMFPTIMTISSLAFAIGLWYGGALVIGGEISLGDFVAFNSYLGMLVWPISAVGWVLNMFQRGSVSLQRINTILDEKPEIEDDPDPAPISSIEGAIEIRDLTFTYPGSSRPALKNINLKLEKGKTLAVVGRTGSGKSTLINLIPRLYDAPAGTVGIDGFDISKIPLELLRNSIACVPQDTFLFSTTIRNNIGFFTSSGEDAITEAARTAMIHDNIMDFPEGYGTLVGERGVTLSGGQKQRVAIARAILRSPSILILDDCLSAVDTGTEEAVLKGLKKLMGQRTSIIVSHRVSTIKDADEIIVLKDGEIAERGSHESLLGLRGDYYELYRKQLLAEQIEEAE